MLIRKMELFNFFRIYDKAEIEFSLIKEKNITIIKGDNGMGKTTMLSAFYWTFYGDILDPLIIEEMLNKRTRVEMQIGETKHASVTIDFHDRNNEYTFQRKQYFKKISDTEIVLAGKPEVFIMNKSQNQPIEDSHYFENLIPEELSGFFFFDGERIDRLAKIDGKEEIKKAILDILGLTNLEHINDNLESVKKEFNAEIKRKTKDKGKQELNDQFDLYSSKLEEQKEIHKTELKKSNQAKKIKQECDKFLEEHNAERIRILKKERARLENEQLSIDGDKSQIGLKRIEEKRILSYISKNFKTVLISRYFEEMNKILDEKRKKKQLPSDIKETFVKDLIESKVCICGRPIIDNSEEREKLTDLLKKAGHEELDSAYTKISAFINSNATKEVVTEFYDEIYKHKDAVLNYNERIEKIKKELQSISNELLNCGDSLINMKEAQREKAEEDIESATKKIGLSEGQIQSYSLELKKLSGKIEKVSGQEQEADAFANCFKMTDKLLQLNNEIQEHFINTTHEDMDKKLKEVFAVLARKQDREPLLSEEFELKIVNKHNHTPQLLSTGERQITSLAFIGALVSYAREKPNMELISDFAGGDYPIVMDSPFGNLDKTHKSNVAKGIPELASQIIIILSNEQWQGEVEENIFHKIGSMYEMTEGETSMQDSEFTVITGGIL